MPEELDCPAPAAPPPAGSNTAAIPGPGDASQDAIVRGWRRRHEENDARAARGGIDVLFQGDSIIEGAAGAAGWKAQFRGLHAADFAIGGDRTENVLWRIQNGELAGFQPRVIVLMIGTNNLYLNTPEEIAVAVQVILYEMRTRQPKVRILLLGLLPRAQAADAPERAEIKALNEKLARCEDGCAITYRDFGSLFLAEDGSIRTELMPDYLHPSPTGYELLAKAILPSVRLAEEADDIGDGVLPW